MFVNQKEIRFNYGKQWESTSKMNLSRKIEQRETTKQRREGLRNPRMLGMIHIANRWSLSLLSNSSRIFLFNDPKYRKCKFSWETNNNYLWITYGRSRDMRLCWFLKPTITKNKNSVFLLSYGLVLLKHQRLYVLLS